ncbi:hypothetical protein ACIP1X_05325 [Pseudomonas sp. NPDC088885]|uniref:hypothetical protein n=1 Tax=Pseudomonas sp. NPDC088885 TaxID=3364457 RepID=UPI0038245CB5
MKRDKQAAKSVLYSVQTYSKADGIDKSRLETLRTNVGYSQEDWDYAVRLLVDSRYLILDDNSIRMTWAGHDLLELLER